MTDITVKEIASLIISKYGTYEGWLETSARAVFEKIEPILEELEELREWKANSVSIDEYENACNAAAQNEERWKDAEEEIRDLNRHTY